MLKTKETHRKPFNCPILGGTAIIAFYVEIEDEQQPIEGNPLVTSHQFNCNSVNICGIRAFDTNGDAVFTDWEQCPAFPKPSPPIAGIPSAHRIE